MNSDYDAAVRNERRGQRAWRRHRVTCHTCRRPRALSPEDTTRCNAGNQLFFENRHRFIPAMNRAYLSAEWVRYKIGHQAHPASESFSRKQNASLWENDGRPQKYKLHPQMPGLF